MQGTTIWVALVSTNSITQSEQMSILGSEMLNRYKIQIQFARRTLKWSNEVRGNANVFCIIVGFGQEALPVRCLFDYDTPKSEPHEIKVKNINPHLVDAENVIVAKRTKPISNVTNMLFGNMPNDGGFLILSEEEKVELLATEPNAAPFVQPFFGSEEFIINHTRWCLWLKDAAPSELQKLPKIRERVADVKRVREASTRDATRRLAQFPQLFGEIRQPDTNYLVMTLVSSENRRFVPIGFAKALAIASNLVSVVPNATPYLFGILTSQMHMAWMRAVCGRLKIDFRYSSQFVYNNFPFLPAPSQANGCCRGLRSAGAGRPRRNPHREPSHALRPVRHAFGPGTRPRHPRPGRGCLLPPGGLPHRAQPVGVSVYRLPAAANAALAGGPGPAQAQSPTLALTPAQ